MAMIQGVLSLMVAHTAQPALDGTAFSFFNLVGGIAILSASTIGGTIWERLGAATTFYAGAAFSVLAAILNVSRRVE